MKKDFYKNVDVFVGIDPAGEATNKQNKISNGMVLLSQWANPAFTQNPITLDILQQVTKETGLYIDPNKVLQMQQQQQMRQQQQQMMMQAQQGGGSPKPEQQQVQQAGRLPEQERQSQQQKALQGQE